VNPPDNGAGDVYRPPEAELREELPPRSWIHPLIGSAAGFVGLLLMDGEFPGDYLSLFVVSSLLAALVLGWFRRVDWRVAIISGFLLSLAISMLLSFIGMKLGF
jgi:hypothetical protein